MHYFLTAICLVLVIEGFMPAIAPRIWRLSMFRVLQMNDNKIRMIGLSSMIIGAVMLYLVQN